LRQANTVLAQRNPFSQRSGSQRFGSFGILRDSVFVDFFSPKDSGPHNYKLRPASNPHHLKEFGRIIHQARAILREQLDRNRIPFPNRTPHREAAAIVTDILYDCPLRDGISSVINRGDFDRDVHNDADVGSALALTCFDGFMSCFHGLRAIPYVFRRQLAFQTGNSIGPGNIALGKKSGPPVIPKTNTRVILEFAFFSREVQLAGAIAITFEEEERHAG
jgi:hypothetical protein